MCSTDVWPPGDEGGFGTEYVDMPYASSAGYRKHSQIRSRLPTYEEPPRLLFMEGEERMWAPEDGKTRAGYLALTLLAILGLVREPHMEASCNLKPHGDGHECSSS